MAANDEILDIAFLGGVAILLFVVWRKIAQPYLTDLMDADSDPSIPGPGPLNALNRLFNGHVSAGDVSVEENLSRWDDTLFGTDDQKETDAAPLQSYSGIYPGSLTQDQMDEIPTAVNNASQALQTDPASSGVDWLNQFFGITTAK